MKNFVQPGDVVTITAAAAALSGAPVLQNGLFGVATLDAAAGDPLPLAIEGVFDLPKDDAAITSGAKVFYTSEGVVSATAGDPAQNIGVAIAASAAGDTTARVKLNGGFVLPA
jgi:predicted RecA/RadA family phage recombinase